MTSSETGSPDARFADHCARLIHSRKANRTMTHSTDEEHTLDGRADGTNRTQVVDTIYGPVRGLVRDGMRQYLGLPYGAPPVGDLRWRPPVAPEGWTEPRDAVNFGDVCAQDTTGLPGFGYHSDTEDCLYLNVFTAAAVSPGRRLPVMFWIPGGGLYCGGSMGYDPSALILAGDVVVVSINYRLNVFGFFSHPAINAEDHPSGNYGIMDQAFALDWVRRNIERFGGNPDNVTIFGESAGAISVLAHLASPGSAGLFHRAITQSCSVAAVSPTATLQSWEHAGIDLATAAGCTIQNPAALRSLTTAQLMEADDMGHQLLGAGKFHIGLVADGQVIPESMPDLFTSGRFNRVPVMNGVNRDEFAWFQAMLEVNTGLVVPEEAYAQALAGAFAALGPSPLLGCQINDDVVPDILERYPSSAHPSPARALAAAIGDCGFITAGGRQTARILRQFVSDVFVYEWDVPDSPVSWPGVSFPYGSGHTQEIQYLFPRFCGGGGVAHDLDDAQQRLAGQMVQYWTTFARRGNPNAESPVAPEWPVYDPEEDAIMSLSLPEPHVTKTFAADHHCDFWDRVRSDRAEPEAPVPGTAAMA